MPSDDQRQPPAKDVIEISLFGPGVGECVVMHLGDGDWIVVDSCLKARGDLPVALAYLSDLGVDVASAVRMVVVTHWHDDHIVGISDVFSRAKSAQLACSAAVDTGDFYTLIRLLQGHDADADEFGALFRELVQRLPPGQRNPGATPVWALTGRSMLRLPFGSNSPRAEVTALSPSDVALRLGHVKIGEELQRANAGGTGRRLVAQSPNEAAIALWVHAGAFDVLLGSDLEESDNPRDGWRAVVSDHIATGRPSAQLLKVPHHGSNDADSPAVWATMLTPCAHAAVTPFRRQQLPGKLDLERLRSRTADLYVTADPKGRKPARRNPAVDRTMREVASRRSVLGGRAGHVRFRAPLAGGAFVVSMFDGAYQVA
jgi:beta-lactamase superfamily II metal-dependent hydrolase